MEVGDEVRRADRLLADLATLPSRRSDDRWLEIMLSEILGRRERVWRLRVVEMRVDRDRSSTLVVGQLARVSSGR